MNTADLEPLAQRAAGVQGRPADRLREVHDRIRVVRRRRRAAGILGGASVVAAAVTVAAIVLSPGGERSGPDPAPSPSPSPSIPSPALEDTALDRPLTYAVGQKVYYGDQVVDTGQQIAQIDITDAGVVYLTQDGELWFTDGERKRRLDAGIGSYHEAYEAVAAAVGSRIAYMRIEDTLPVSVVVYDVAAREVVLEEPAGPSVWPDFDLAQPQTQAMFLTADQVVVYYSDDNYRSRDVGQIRYISYDLGTGRRTELPLDAPDTVDVAPPARRLEWRARGGSPENLLPASTDVFRVRDGALTVDVFDDSVGIWRVADPIDPVTGERLIIPMPAGIAPGTELKLFQWLDDGVFALVRMITQTSGDDGDLMVVCTLTVLNCEVAVEGPHRFILPGRAFYE